jgi:hypothetical protein
MTYKYDVFISYRRHPETYLWISEHFEPLLKLRVGLELGREPSVYVDDQIESGTSWPVALGLALGHSRTLIPLWSGNFLSSVWCTEELSHMLVREKEEELRTAARPHGVVIPAFIHDGNKFPSGLGHIEYFEIQKCFNVRMARNSLRAEELEAALAVQAPAIAACIDNAPAWRESWPSTAAETFFERFHQQLQAVQTTVPRFTGQ